MDTGRKQEYKQKLRDFFETYSEKRREWSLKVAYWKEIDAKEELRARIESLMAQIEDYHNAISELLAQADPDFNRIARMQKQMQKCYKELAHEIKPIWQQWLEAIIVAGGAAFLIRTYVFGLYHVPTGSAEPNILVGDRIFGNKLSYAIGNPKRGDLVIFDDPEFVYDRSSAFQRFWQKYIGFPILGLLRQGPDNWVKRVIGVPGDTLEGRIEDGKTVVYRNGEKLDEHYINPYPLLSLRKHVGFFDPNSALGMLVPTFLNGYFKQVRYTYDDTVSFEEQPFYQMAPEEVLRHARTGQPVLYPSQTPSYNVHGRNVDIFGPITVPEGKYWVQGDSRLNSKDSRYWGFLDRSLVQGKAAFIIWSLDSEEPFWFLAMLKNPIKFFTRLVRWTRFFRGLIHIPDIRRIETVDQKVENNE